MTTHSTSLSRRTFMAGAGTLAVAPTDKIRLPAEDITARANSSVGEQELLDAMRIRATVTTWPLPSNQMVPKDAVSLCLMVAAAERMVEIIQRRADIGPGSAPRIRALLMLLQYVYRDVGLPALMPDFIHRVELAAHYLTHHPELLWPGAAELGALVEPGRTLPGAPTNTFVAAHTVARFQHQWAWRAYSQAIREAPVGPVVWQSPCERNMLHRIDSPMGVFITGVELKSPIACQFSNPPIRTSVFNYPGDLPHLLFWRFIASGAYTFYAFKMDGRTSGYFAVCTGTLFDCATNWFLRDSALADFVRSMSVATAEHGPLLSCCHRNPHVPLEPVFSRLARMPDGTPWPDRSYRFVIPRDYGEVV